MSTDNGSNNVEVVLDFLCGRRYFGSQVSDGFGPFEVFFVFGHYLAEIAVHAAAVWSVYPHPRRRCPILISGGINERSRPRIPPEYETEADYYAYLIRIACVPDNLITVEREAHNTLENVLNCVSILEGLTRGKKPQEVDPRVAVCVYPPLFRRTEATLRMWCKGYELRPCLYPLPPGWLAASPTRPAFLLKELKSLREYAKKGDIAEVVIPPEVEEAERVLSQK